MMVGLPVVEPAGLRRRASLSDCSPENSTLQSIGGAGFCAGDPVCRASRLRYNPDNGASHRSCAMKTFLALIGVLAIVLGIGAAVFFFGGFYSVAGTAAEPAFVKWALVQVRQASIARNAKDRPTADLTNAEVVK